MIDHCLRKHPWLLIVFCFLLFMAAWASLIAIAVKHRPQAVEMPPHPAPVAEKS